MKRFTSPGHAQVFLFAFSGISPHFRPVRHRLSAPEWRTEMADRFAVWPEVTASGVASASVNNPNWVQRRVLQTDCATTSLNQHDSSFWGAPDSAAELSTWGLPTSTPTVCWFAVPDEHGGGILADEISLGGTLQAITMMAIQTDDGPHLVVRPTSAIGN